MGSWGTGVYQNDHAKDLLSIEVDDLVESITDVLDGEDADWTDIEGPLIYVHLLGLLAAHTTLGLEAGEVEKWKKRYLEIYDESLAEAEDEAAGEIKSRRGVIVATFDELRSRLSLAASSSKASKAKPSRGKPTPRKPAATPVAKKTSAAAKRRN